MKQLTNSFFCVVRPSIQQGIIPPLLDIMSILPYFSLMDYLHCTRKLMFYEIQYLTTFSVHLAKMENTDILLLLATINQKINGHEHGE